MRTSVALALFAATACGSSDFGPQGPGGDMVMEAEAANSPYEVELVSGAQTLPTYAHKSRFYTLGQVGQRYAIRVKNPTASRVEAVISVDGLDVIDGETANSSKRGYVIMPQSSITIDGFRVSTSQVAAFRFSSVDDSYAGRKGKARNVGVIGVAIFAEKEAQTLVLPQNRVADRSYDEGEDDGDYAPAGDKTKSDRVGSTESRRIRQSASKRRPAPSITGGTAEGAAQPDMEIRPREEECCGPRTNRPGLGTEYGERRYSAVGFTRFVRASNTQPTAYAELRYNNAAGLAALGITTGPGFDENEVTRRETAEPFPGQRFSQPPR